MHSELLGCVLSMFPMIGIRKWSNQCTAQIDFIFKKMDLVTHVIASTLKFYITQQRVYTEASQFEYDKGNEFVLGKGTYKMDINNCQWSGSLKCVEMWKRKLHSISRQEVSSREANIYQNYINFKATSFW